jgi:excisionase family DNA binding protein
LRLSSCAQGYRIWLARRDSGLCEPQFTIAAMVGGKRAVWSNPAMAYEPNEMPLAMRPREAAKALGISPRLLWQLTHDGHIPCVRIGTGKRRTVLYPITDLMAWLDQQVAAAKGGHDDATH